jgi:hypothetical protein
LARRSPDEEKVRPERAVRRSAAHPRRAAVKTVLEIREQAATGTL